MNKYQSSSTILNGLDIPLKNREPNMKVLAPRIFAQLTKHAFHNHTKIISTPVLWNNKNVTREYCSENSPKKKAELLPFPVFPLRETIKKFMKSAEPFLTKEEMEKDDEIVDDFARKQGVQLQKLLQQVAGKEENWLAERWLYAAYLRGRDPVTVYSSPGMTFPLREFHQPHDVYQYGGKVIHYLLKYKQIIDNDELPITKMGKRDLDNSQFHRVFGTNRTPKNIVDCLEFNPCSKHIVIIHRNHFYKANVYTDEGEPLHPTTLCCILNKVVDAEKNCDEGLPFGALTSTRRDHWAAAYDEIIKIPGNKESIDEIKSALFTVSLDCKVQMNKGKEFDVLGGQLIHGGGVNSGNRWMDKTIQLILNINGISGFAYEHSPAEGQPIANMCDYVLKYLDCKLEPPCSPEIKYETVTKLKLLHNECINNHVRAATLQVNRLANNLKLGVLHFKKYGKELIKNHKLSPDSYIQMALQYTFYKIHGCPGAQYESAHLRLYKNGRTETIRSCSVESVAFAKGMLDSNLSPKQKIELLRAAVNAHRKYTSMALEGQGVDRHLLGLKLMAEENGLPLPSIFGTLAYCRSSNFRVSTSQVASKYLSFMCYGPLTDDGYSCCYNPRDNDMILACGSWQTCRETDIEKFKKELSESLKTMGNLLEETKEVPKANL